ncbi:hypothetical protein Tco_0537261 [Tanacetum coccineum]
MKGTDVVGYTQRFQELALLCLRMVPEEEDKVERYIWGLPDSIQGNVTSTRTTRLQDTVKLANSLMDQKIPIFVARQADNKRRMKKNARDDHVQQPPYKRQNVARVYTAGLVRRKSMLEPYPCAINGNITILDRALQSAETTRGLVIKPRIIGVCLPQQIKGLRWKIKEPLLSWNIGKKGTIVVNAQS